MSLYYYGLDIKYLALLTVIFAVLSGIAIYNFFIQNKKPWNFPAFIFPIITLVMVFTFFDLKSPIDNDKATELQTALETSRQIPNGGMEFNKAVGDLAKENGVLVDGNTSYIGKDIYVTYIKKSDWNRLAKMYNDLY